MQHFHTSLHGDVNLNEALYIECAKKELDYNKIEELLKIGANPLGVFNIDTRSTPYAADVVYGEILDYYSHDNSEESNSDSAYNITKLFLDYGMNIKKKHFQMMLVLLI